MKNNASKRENPTSSRLGLAILCFSFLHLFGCVNREVTLSDAIPEIDKTREAKILTAFFGLDNPFLIGVLIGIVVFSLFKSTFGFLMLIPLYFVHKMVNDPRNKRIKEVEALPSQRNLKKTMEGDL
ncbi:hypothetical protein [Aquiflexum gelatinilyticum]|uniref:Uncharacterized protein n=1 Tax=Aquiflexum gelatinilyticum TaxID=2961943 RepID=A0A9X2P7E1_9BACT|nr:hypothetical protein [Aquiflexum gelatinilyticum]MCR9013585.1 hypothetical protein [Aquiflexum gelatinilyticum]